MSAIRTHDLITHVDTDALEWEEVGPGTEHQPSTPDGCTFLVVVPGNPPIDRWGMTWSVGFG